MSGRGPRGAAGAGRGGGPGPEERGVARRLAVAVGTAGLLVVGVAACDNVVKYVDTFADMVDGPAVETYEEQPTPPPEGAVPVSGQRPSYPIPVADTTSALQNPLAGTGAELERGRELYTTYCLPCHGPEGRGRGPVVNHDGAENPDNNNRLPMIPTLDLTSDTGPERSDGYIWGIIENGRPPLMPDYRRMDPADRWYVIEYVRELQRRAGAEPVRGVAGPEESAGSGEAAAGAGGGTG